MHEDTTILLYLLNISLSIVAHNSQQLPNGMGINFDYFRYYQHKSVESLNWLWKK